MPLQASLFLNHTAHHFYLHNPNYFFFCSILISRFPSPSLCNSHLSHRFPPRRKMGPVVLTQLATGISVLAGAVIVKSVMDQKPMAGPFQRCPTCNGTGRVNCLCSRWSDGDVGCRTCAGSGRMACSSCGGSGTGRPIRVRISARPPSNGSS